MSTSKHRWSSRLARTTLLAFAGLGVIAAVAVAATINGGGGDDILVGTPSADVINGKGGMDVVYGNPGNDYIDGGTGSDYHGFDCPSAYDDHPPFGLQGCYEGLEGGSGSDQISGGSGNDWIEGDGVDCPLEQVGDNYEGPACYGAVEVSNNAAGNDSLNGGIGDDYIDGNQKDDTLIGGAGSDELEGGSGNDRIYARDGEVDYIYCGSGSDLVQYDKTLDVFHDNNGEPKPFANSDCEAPLTT